MDGIKGPLKINGLSGVTETKVDKLDLKDLNKKKDAAEKFEAMLVHEMMKSMWNTVPKSGMISGSSEEQTFRDMLSEAVADSVSKGQGIGIKDVIYKDMNKLDKKQSS